MDKIALKTTRLSLIPLETDHEEVFYELLRRNRAYLQESFPITVLSTDSPTKTNRYLNQIAHNWEQDTGGHFGIWLEDALIGSIIIKNIDWSIPKCELAYYLDHQMNRKGYMTEALLKVIDFCFQEMEMTKIFVRVIAGNKASETLALKCGFEKEGYLKKEYRTGKRQLVDLIYYGLIKTDTDN